MGGGGVRERQREREKLGQQTKMDSVETSDCNV